MRRSGRRRRGMKSFSPGRMLRRTQASFAGTRRRFSVRSQPRPSAARAMVAILSSPRFLFRVERTAAHSAADAFSPIDEYSLASRLSYFLWSTMPDDELFGMAERGELRKNLLAQVDRLLKDPRSQSL